MLTKLAALSHPFMDSNRGVELSHKASHPKTHYNELQHNIDSTQSFARQNLDGIHTKLPKSESLPIKMSQIMSLLSLPNLGHLEQDQTYPQGRN